jgi:thiamine transport system ATP-binding protein
MRLTLEDVRKEYGETVALGSSAEVDRPDSGAAVDRPDSGIDLDVEDGEFFTLVGPSGCGKTTTLRLVAGFESPTAGTISFDGRDMRGVPPEDRGVGVVFQNYALFPHLSVAENVAYGLRFSDPPGGESREERVAALLELVDLPDAGDRDPSELSGGQQQRVALARALAPGPDLLLLDEPMSALDARLRERLRMQVKEIQSTLGITTLYVTHDQEEALAISDRVAVMNDGRIEQVGTPQTVYRRPDTRFVAAFVGDNNVFKGEIVSVDRDLSVERDVSIDGFNERDAPVDRSDERGTSDERSAESGVESPESPVETKGLGGMSDSTDERPAGGVSLLEVDVDGTVFAIQTDRSVARGDRVTFCVRPEQMRVRPVDAERSDEDDRRRETESENVIETTVSKSEFLGESTRMHLRWNGREIRVRSIDPLSGGVRVGFDAGVAHVVGVEANGDRSFEANGDR